jgi:glycosyltransferase involved in cell wall biosynthesis
MHSSQAGLENRPKYSIIIPTRDRYQYLSSCVDSALEFGTDVEVIVSVNGDDESLKIARKFLGFRLAINNLKLICTRCNMSMVESFDFAVKAATGRYVTTVGDDDAVMFCYRQQVDKYFDNNPDTILTWYRSAYYWNDTIGEGLLVGTGWKEPVKIMFEDKLDEIRKRSVSYNELPNIYNSFIPRKFLDFVRNINLLETGHDLIYPYNECCAPDIFSGIQNTYLLKGYYYLCEAPVTLSCISARSNGLAAQSKKTSNDEANKFNKENNMNSFEQMTEKYLVKSNSVQMYNAAIQVFTHRILSKLKRLGDWMPTNEWLYNLVDSYISCEANEYPEYANDYLRLMHTNGLSYREDILVSLVCRAKIELQNHKEDQVEITQYTYRTLKEAIGCRVSSQIRLKNYGCINSYQAVLFYEAIYENN